MTFDRDTWDSFERRKKLAAWIMTLKGPGKPAAKTLQYDSLAAAMQNNLNMQAQMFNAGRVEDFWRSVGAGIIRPANWMGNP